MPDLNSKPRKLRSLGINRSNSPNSDGRNKASPTMSSSRISAVSIMIFGEMRTSKTFLTQTATSTRSHSLRLYSKNTGRASSTQSSAITTASASYVSTPHSSATFAGAHATASLGPGSPSPRYYSKKPTLKPVERERGRSTWSRSPERMQTPVRWAEARFVEPVAPDPADRPDPTVPAREHGKRFVAIRFRFGIHGLHREIRQILPDSPRLDKMGSAPDPSEAAGHTPVDR